MGQKHGSLNPTQLSDLRQSTHFTDDELITFHKEFMKSNPSGRLTKDEMMRQYRELFPEGDPQQFTEQLFTIYDANEDGSIDFREFICGMGLMTHGSPEQKLKTAFRMCDLDNDGCISKWELEAVITAIYNAIAPGHSTVGDGKAAKTVATSIFVTLDKNQDEKITYEEFVTGTGSNPDILLLLETMSS